MSPTGIETIVGNLPKQESYIVDSVFDSGISDFDKNELEVMKMSAAVLFTKIRQIEKAEAEAELEETEEKVTQTV